MNKTIELLEKLYISKYGKSIKIITDLDSENIYVLNLKNNSKDLIRRFDIIKFQEFLYSQNLENYGLIYELRNNYYSMPSTLGTYTREDIIKHAKDIKFCIKNILKILNEKETKNSFNDFEEKILPKLDILEKLILKERKKLSEFIKDVIIEDINFILSLKKYLLK